MKEESRLRSAGTAAIYNKAGACVMDIVKNIIKYVNYPFELKLLHREELLRSYQDLQKKQYRSFQENAAEQRKLLYEIVSYAVAHVPYYRNIAHGRNISLTLENIEQDLRKFPVLTKEIIKKEKEIRQAFGKVKCKQCGKCCKLAVSEFDHKTLLDKAKNGDITAKRLLEVFEPYPNNLLPDEVFGFYPALNLQPCSANNLQNGFQDDGLASPQNHRQNNLHCDLQSNAQDSQQPGLDNCAESNFADSQQNDGQSCCADELCYFYRCNKVKTLNGAYFCPIYTKRPSVCRNFPDTPLENLPNGCAYIEWKKENTEKALYIKALNDIRKHYLKMIQNMMTK